jgi:ADP-heptose:LPS heptosyltransferase
MGSKDDIAVCDAIAAALPRPVANLCGKTSMVELGGWLKAMDLLVTVDSGPMHMAAAIGVPVVAVFGPTFPGRTGPYGPRHRVVQQGSDLGRLPAAPVTEAALDALGIKS